MVIFRRGIIRTHNHIMEWVRISLKRCKMGREIQEMELHGFDELEMSPATYQNAEKLATFYLLYDHLYIQKEPINRIESVHEVIIDKHGESEFLQLISGQKAEDIWNIIDELMDAVRTLQPRLYQATIDRLKG